MIQTINRFRSALLRGELLRSASFAATARFALCEFVRAWLLSYRSEFEFAEDI